MSIQEIKSKLSDEFIKMLEEVYSQSELDSIYRSYEKGRYTSFRINTIKGQPSVVLKELRENKIKAIDFFNVPNAFYIRERAETDLKKLSCYKDGKIYVQNISSMLPPLTIIFEGFSKFIDICAAPGGKSLYLASLLDNNCSITSNEPNDIRREVLAYNIKKQGAKSIEITAYDGRCILKNIDEIYDCAIVDVPCSGEGVLKIRRDGPLLKYSGKKINSYFKVQKKILKNAIEMVRVGGCIIYSTCTLNPIENESVISEILKDGKVTVEKIDFNIKGVKSGITSFKGEEYHKEVKNTVRIVPSEFLEGFFIAKLRKIK